MIKVSKEAAEWFIRELGIAKGQTVRFYPRYASGGHVHPGFSLGIGLEEPEFVGISTVVEDITFYMEDRDLWYLDEYDLTISYNNKEDDVIYGYHKD